ncbi:MAG TPA: molybdopterin cofactor-binding domain-containing protein [Dongiaceae bacterium]|nr:molybdopterin cofactor-binding domain-containing protein [Dongiaceae bacterium]
MVIVERERSGRRLLSVDDSIETSAPGFLQAPQEMATSFAFESAVDELAYKLGQDPVEMRLRNDTRQNAITGKRRPPYHLVACLRRGAELLGWSRRLPTPGSMRDADGGWIGLGVAVGAYRAAAAPALARVRLNADGSVEAAIGGHEIDRGIRVAIALVLADRLGVDLHRIQITTGETLAPPQPTGEAGGTAAAAAAIDAAAQKIRAELINLARAAAAGPLSEAASDGVAFIDNHLVLPDGRRDSVSAILGRAGRAAIDGESQQAAAGQSEDARPWASANLAAIQGPIYPDAVALSFAAHFAEVHINPGTRQVRVAKAVGVFDCGCVASARTARRRALAGLASGIGAALSEAGEVDVRFGGFRKAGSADYRIPATADLQDLVVEFINEAEPETGAIGARGIGAVASAGTAAAIANAIYHATGRRFCKLPIRADNLFEAG